MKSGLPLSLLLLAATTPAYADSAGDPRLSTLSINHATMMQLDTSARTSQTLLTPQGERIASVLLSDPAAYQVTVAGAGDSLVLRANGPRSIAVMTVQTDRQEYIFQLVSIPEGEVPVVVSLTRDNVEAEDASALSPDLIPASQRRTWKVQGDKAVQPLTVIDDGERTYVEWAKDQAMPATFAVSRTGNEETVNGQMRFGMYTIDRVFDRLVFRIDSVSATAQPEREGSRGREHR